MLSRKKKLKVLTQQNMVLHQHTLTLLYRITRKDQCNSIRLISFSKINIYIPPQRANKLARFLFLEKFQKTVDNKKLVLYNNVTVIEHKDVFVRGYSYKCVFFVFTVQSE